MLINLIFFFLCLFFTNNFCFPKNTSLSAEMREENQKGDAEVCYFFPPSSWSLADPSTLSKRVKVAFFGKGEKGFQPSLNLSVEEIATSASEYLKAVKKIHEKDSAKRWRHLGKFNTAAGEAMLTEIDTRNSWGAIRLLQLIFVKEKSAYILTACALKEEFVKFYKDFQKAFHSFTLTRDLTEAVSPSLRREELRSQLAKMQEAASPEDKEHFRRKILDDFTDMGSYWQLLMASSQS
jgi:hypothetical protein